MSSKNYKLIEVTREEHIALHEAGAWVNWSVGDELPENLLEDESFPLMEAALLDVILLNPNLKFYTRVMVDDDVS